MNEPTREAALLHRALILLREVNIAEGSRLAGDLKDGRKIEPRTLDEIANLLAQVDRSPEHG